MEPLSTGQLVKVSGAGPDVDGIVFDASNDQKIVVAVLDPKRGPGMRTVGPEALAERAEEGATDSLLRGLIRRSMPRAGSERGAGKGSVQGRRGHKRAATHRTTGR